MTTRQDGVDHARSVVDRVLSYLVAEQRQPAAASLRAQRDAPRPSVPTIVVAGEDKRGKSSLVNALLASPDLSPVGVKVVTGVPVTFVHSPTPFAQVRRYGSDTAEPIPVETARRFATVDGNPANEQNIESITIGLPLPPLEFMSLIDTPGVGGLASGHAALTLQSLHSADALLFVVDASAPIRAAELAFLRQASTRLQAVVLVVTKTDTHPGWRQILQDNVKILAEQAPRFAGCASAGVSSLSALRALALDDAEFAAEIRVESGIAALEEMLRVEIAAAVESVRMQNLLRAAISRLAIIERDLADRHVASASDSAGMEALNQQVATLSSLRQDRVEWQMRLDSDIRKLTVIRQDACARRTLEIKHRYEERSRDASVDQFSSMPGEVLAELTALASELNALAAQRLAEITSDLLDGLDAEISVRDSIDEIADSGLAGVDPSFVPSGRRLAHAERMEMLSELGRGRSLLSLASGSSALAFLAPPFGIVLGVGLGGLFAFTSWRARTRQSQAADFRIWLQEQVANAQLSIRNDFELRVVDLQNEIKSTVRRVLADREQALMASIEEAKVLRRTDAQSRAAVRQRLTQSIASAQTLRTEAADALSTLSSTGR